MDSNERVGLVNGVWFVVAVVVFLAAVVVYVIVAASTYSDFTDTGAYVPLLFVGAAGFISLVSWWRDRVNRVAVEESLRREREQLESRLEDREEALDRERQLRSRAEEVNQVEKKWRQELYGETIRMYRERGALGDPSDVPSMVLRLARTLLEGEKGLLFWRREEDGKGNLELAASEGFEHDPENSMIVRHFAEEVLERDQTIHESNSWDIEAEQRTEADEEIENLVAVPIYLQDQFNGVVVCANNPNGFDDYDNEVLLSVGDQAGVVLQNARLQGELRTSYLATVAALANAIEVKDPFLRGHSEEVANYVAAVAERLGLPPKRREELTFGSLLHDIGKIGISERILLKPTDLAPEEFEVVKLHPRIGYKLVQQVPALRSIAPAMLYHHERFDGGGYPSGLRGEDIPLEARIICVADSFSAMISERPYRERMTLEDACAELERCAGSQFDPEIARIFVEEVRRSPSTPKRESIPALEDDSELEVQRRGDEPILGYGTLTLTDNLTLLYTRRYFHEVVHAEAQKAALQSRPFGVVLLELAEIPELNQRVGYAAGDQAIQTAARMVQSVAVRHDGTACRYSGRRLGLIIPGADEETIKLIAAEISADFKDGPDAHVATATWRPHDTGDTVIDRARTSLSNLET
ncbi:MAG: HD domain-containing protein, partial [Rubrobacter sp.]|nr:HD domain-containing protein [Rubrobacter sp.]